MAGEIKGKKVKGGHVVKLMEDTHPTITWTDGKPAGGQPIGRKTWTLDNKSKMSTLFPPTWSWDDVKEKTAKYWKSKNKWVDDVDWKIKRTGDTFYPDV